MRYFGIVKPRIWDSRIGKVDTGDLVIWDDESTAPPEVERCPRGRNDRRSLLLALKGCRPVWYKAGAVELPDYALDEWRKMARPLT